MKKALFLIGFLLLVNIVSAQNFTVTDYKIDVELYPSGLVKEKITLQMTNMGEDVDFITYSLFTKPENIVVYDETGDLNYNITKNEEYHIVIWKEIRNGETTAITLEFNTKGLVEQTENKHIFSFSYIPPTIIEKLQINLKLPLGFILSEIAQSVSPKPSNMYTDGKNIILQWSFENLGEELAIITIYERGFPQEPTNYLIYGLLVVTIIGVAIVALFYRKEKMDVAMMTLTEDERMIINKIIERGEILQKKLVREIGFSKVKVSKLIRRLEEKGIVEKIPWMRTNKLRLSKKVRR